MHSILSVHNHYRQPGGEDEVFANEARLLEQRGHSVVRYTEQNARIGSGGFSTVRDAVWSQKSFEGLRSTAKAGFDIAHFHNTFPLISPSAYYAMRTMEIPVVQTLHNYRLLCPAATFVRDGNVCEACPDSHSLLPAIRHRCYRDSRSATAAVATMLTVHRAAGTWKRLVNVYIALSEFARDKFVAGGLPAERVAIKPNFLSSDPGIGKGEGSYALFVGRLGEEKGVRVLANAWRRLSGIPLVVAGKGPLEALEWPPGVTLAGHQSRQQVYALMRDARVLIFPSICYEGSPLTIIEALACGLPVIASDLGSIPEYVTHRKTGLLFQPSDNEDLIRNVRWAWEHPEELREMRAAARCEYEEKYTAERNYKILMEIYDRAIESARSRRAVA